MTDRSKVFPADPGAGYLARKAEIDEAINRTLKSGKFILGEEVSLSEHEFSEYLGVFSALGVANGTDAITLGLLSGGIQPGDEVITVSHTASATVAAIERSGGVAVFVDIEPATFTMNPDQLDAALSPRTKAIVPVHMYGHPTDMIRVCRFAETHGLDVVEDCAQSHGASIGGRMTGAWGEVGAFSFYPTKNLGALGDGGMLSGQNLERLDRARLVREYGWKERYVSSVPGMNSRLDDIQAAVVRVKLAYLDQDNHTRKRLADLYRNELGGRDLVLPVQRTECSHVYHQFVVRIQNRDALREHMESHGIIASVLYPVPVHLQPAYRKCRVSSAGLVETERAADQILCLPIYPELTEKAVARVIQAVTSFS